jgi:hypothetical protein
VLYDSDQKQYINGSLFADFSTHPALTSSANIYLGWHSNQAVGSEFRGKVWSFSIDKDGTADDRNFVPVCNLATGFGGMFDTLHNVF